jgi:Glycosyltransferase family 87
MTAPPSGRSVAAVVGPRTLWHRPGLLALEDRVFTGPRIQLYAGGIVVALAVALCWAFGHGRWLFHRDGRLGDIDFCWIWFSGKFAAAGDPSRIYDSTLYTAAYRNFYHPGECRLLLEQYIYPPTFLLLTYLLGLLPYLAAYAAWVGATLLLYLAALYLVLPGWTTVVVALTPFAVLSNITLGHNAFLTAGLFGLALLLLQRRPWLAGILLGLMTYKPQLGLLLPLGLLASRNWRAWGGATATTLALGVAATLAFGGKTWPAFAATLFDRTAGLSPQPGIQLLLGSVYGLLQRAGAAPWIAWTAQLAVMSGLAVAVCVVWSRPFPYALKAAMLAVASLLATPYLLGYDLCTLSVAVAFLVADGLERGFLAGERTILLACLFLLYVPRAALGPFVFALILLLIFRRMAFDGRPGEHPPPPDARRATGATRRAAEVLLRRRQMPLTGRWKQADIDC